MFEINSVITLYMARLTSDHLCHTSIYEKLFETSDILSDIYMLSGGHSSKLWWTFSILLGIFSVFLSDIMSDVLGENVGHGVQNASHVRMSNNFSYLLLHPSQT